SRLPERAFTMFERAISDGHQPHAGHRCPELQGDRARHCPRPNHSYADHLTRSFTLLKSSIDSHDFSYSSASGQLRSCLETMVISNGHWIPNAGSSKRAPRTAPGV